MAYSHQEKEVFFFFSVEFLTSFSYIRVPAIAKFVWDSSWYTIGNILEESASVIAQWVLRLT